MEVWSCYRNACLLRVLWNDVHIMEWGVGRRRLGRWEGGACDTSIKSFAKIKNIPAVLLHSATKNTSLKNIYYYGLLTFRCCSRVVLFVVFTFQHHILIFSFKIVFDIFMWSKIKVTASETYAHMEGYLWSHNSLATGSKSYKYINIILYSVLATQLSSLCVCAGMFCMRVRTRSPSNGCSPSSILLIQRVIFHSKSSLVVVNVFLWIWTFCNHFVSY